jgi:hypothetical protein
MIQAQNNDAVGGIPPYRLKAGDHPRNLAIIDAAHPGFTAVAVKMDVENAFLLRTSMVRSLHRPGYCVTADAGADAWIIHVLTIGNRVIAG